MGSYGYGAVGSCSRSSPTSSVYSPSPSSGTGSGGTTSEVVSNRRQSGHVCALANTDFARVTVQSICVAPRGPPNQCLQWRMWSAW